jgi:hypothetical protein
VGGDDDDRARNADAFEPGMFFFFLFLYYTNLYLQVDDVEDHDSTQRRQR